MNVVIREKQSALTPVRMEGCAAGHHYTVTPDLLLRDGKPYIYRMGELHYSRVPEVDWERELSKMKAGGIDIVASYVFWSHHEPEEGKFDFSGRRNIRRFIDTCEKLGLPFFLRIGPWAHGEARLGGFPDWLAKKSCKLRSMDETYLSYVRRLFAAIYDEVGTSRNIIGIQVENELTGNSEYLQYLQSCLREIGFSAPIWSATAWGQADLPDTLVPMFGGYPEAPWAGHTHKLDPNANYFFAPVREDGIIGEDLLGRAEGETHTDIYDGKYPFLTCELGGGNQNTYHRRPLISAQDIEALAVCKLGSGANGLGYYMYHGGVNPVARSADGTLITSQESRESGYPNDCPIVSYDFQSPLGDCGQVRDSYYRLLTLHRFVDAMGALLAPMKPFFPEPSPADLHDMETPRISVRSDGKSGFLFFNNHAHAETMSHKRVIVHLAFPGESLEIPLEMPSGSCGIIPFHLHIGGETVKYVTAMPVSYTASRVVFAPIPGIAPEICLPDGTVRPLDAVDQIGSASMVLEAQLQPERETLEPLECTRVPNALGFEAFAYLERLDGIHLTDHTAEYEAILADGTALAAVRVYGNTAAAYSMDEKEPRLLSDHFCDGDMWYIDVRGVKRLRLKIQPLGAEDRGTIYFEHEMPEDVVPPELFSVNG